MQTNDGQPSEQSPGFRIFELGRLASGGGCVSAVELTAGKFKAAFINYGARLLYMHMDDRRGSVGNILLRYDDVYGYEKDNAYLGATIGRVANRISEGQFEFDGETYILPVNEPKGGNHLHGGPKGLHTHLWQMRILRFTEGPNRIGVEFTTEEADGAQGYPGRAVFKARYTLSATGELATEYSTTCGRKTVSDLTNHAYWNLSSRAKEGATVKGHLLKMNSSKYLETNGKMVPTGELVQVDGTSLDFRNVASIEQHLDEMADGELDHYFVIDEDAPVLHAWVCDENVELRHAATLEHPGTGRELEVFTDQPGLQVYSANRLSRISQGRWRDYGALCLETQGYPNAVNEPTFPSIEVTPDVPRIQRTVWRFSLQDQDHSVY